MKCIVTGAAGFIGSHLCERLINDGHEVIGLDDLSSGIEANLSALKDNHRFHFVKVDISGDALINPHEIFYGTDWVFHLAAKADVVPSIDDPALYHRCNVTGTMRVLEMARKVSANRFIYAASSSCYGIPSKYPTGEGSAIRLMYPYALTKWVGEQYVLHWSKVYKIPAVSLRLFNVYGPRSRTSGAYGAVFGVFMSQIANGKPCTVVGNGMQARDFTYVSDVVEGFIKAAYNTATGQAFNIGSGDPHSVNELTMLLGAQETVRVPDRPGEPRKTHARNSKAYMWLNWAPKVLFKDGVNIMKELIPQFKNAPLWTKQTIEKATESWFKHLGH